jgi:hypothetical protein
MKTILTAAAVTLFAASVSAGSIYHGFERGNPDLSSSIRTHSGSVTAAQPGVGASFDRYHGWADGNPDLFSGQPTSAPMGHSGPADVYHGWADGNPDL